MSGEEGGPVVVRAGGGEQPEIRFSVHIHVDGGGGTGVPFLGGRGKTSSWVMPAMVVLIAAGIVWLAGRSGMRGADAAPSQAVASTAPAPAQASKREGEERMPAALAAALDEKPLVIPPPGATAAPAAPAGPAAFGLSE